MNSYQAGRHFLQIPGPTNLPERIAHAISRSTIDHRGPEFSQLTHRLLEQLGVLFETHAPIIIYPSSARGAWEAALVNTLSPGDRVLFCDSGHFAALWGKVAANLGLEVEHLRGDWRLGVDPAAVEARLAEDGEGHIKALAVVHNETSTGVVNHVAEIRRALDGAGHPALFMVDVVSSLASMPYLHDEWQVDVTVAGSQKGLMLPPGLGFTAISEKALAATRTAGLPRSYWDWNSVLDFNKRGHFPYTPATNLLFGLDEALKMLFAEGLEQVFIRHQRLAAATREAVRGWGLELYCLQEDRCSATLTGVLMPEGHDADAFRRTVLERFNMSLGTGLGQVQGQLFRIGHLGDFNDLMLAAALSGVEMGLHLCDVPYQTGGVTRALQYLSSA